MGVLYGADLSHNNPVTNWSQVNASGKAFLWHKATQGISFTDSQFAAFMKNCTLKKGTYHFMTTDNITAQAKHFLSVISPYKANLGWINFLDVENTDNSSLSGLGKTVLTARIRTFLDYMEAQGYSMGIYTNQTFCNSYIDLTQIPEPLIFARPEASAPGYSCAAWQYTWIGTLSGVSGKVDLDRAYSDLSVSAVRANYCDTSSLTLCPGMEYTFKTGSPLTCADRSFTKVTQKAQGGYYYTTFKANSLTAGVGFYLNGNRVCVAAVKSATCDTAKVSKPIGQIYQFKTNFPIVCGTPAIWAQQGNSIKQGDYYFTKFKAVKKGSAGFYCGSTRVCIGTVI